MDVHAKRRKRQLISQQTPKSAKTDQTFDGSCGVVKVSGGVPVALGSGGGA